MTWTIGNDSPCWTSPRRTVWFIYRRVGGSTEYKQTDTGRMCTWKSKEACESFYNQLTKRAV